MSTTFSTIADRRRRGTYDAALELRDYAATAISATTSGTGVVFACRKIESFKVCFDFAAYTGYVATSAEWTVAVEVSATLGGSYTAIGSILPAQLAGVAGEAELVFGGAQVASALATAEYIRVTATKTGAAGNLTYGAWIVPT